MSVRLLFITFLLCLLTACGPDKPRVKSDPMDKHPDLRTWTLNSGTEVEGSFVKVDGDYVIIKRINGKEAMIKRDELSDNDQKYLSVMAYGSEEE